MTDGLHGGCRCGAVRYRIAVADAPRAYACHCLDCQTWTGSAFSQQILVAEEALTISGPVTVYDLTSPSGRLSRQRLCGICHTRIYNTTSGRPGLAIVRAGTLDNSDTLTMAAHIWVKRKQPWLVLDATLPAWPEAPPPNEFLAALTRP